MSSIRTRTCVAASIAMSAALLAACGQGGGGDGDTRTLSFAYVTSENSPHGQALSWWLDEVEEPRKEWVLQFVKLPFPWTNARFIWWTNSISKHTGKKEKQFILYQEVF